MPAKDLSLVNLDPADPLPYSGEGLLLTDLTPEAIDRMVAAFVGSPLLHLEVRQLGGAAAVRSPIHGVLDAIDQPFVCFSFGLDLRPRCARGRGSPGPAADRGHPAVGQRPALPQLRRVADGPTLDLPGRVV